VDHPANHFFEHTPASLADWCKAVGMPKFRAGQILEWVYQRGVIDPAAMTNLSKRDRDLLSAEMTFLSGPAVAHQQATDGTEKLLIEWTDGLVGAGVPADEAAIDHANRLPIIGQAMPYSDTARQTECVMIPSKPTGGADSGHPSHTPDSANQTTTPRRTACISSQVGCPVGCRFCASGLGGLDGNLSAGRIVEQAWRLAQLPGIDRLTNIVFMGMGEPLANFAPVTAAVRTLAADWALGISARKITISTVGIHSQIERLADELDLPVTLALSLHAPNDDLRRQLIPWAEFTTIDALLSACRKWFDKTGREITLEYILLGGVNDLPEHAHQLAAVAKSLRANVNLIRYNEVTGLPYKRPRTEDVARFQHILRTHDINAHIRASRGRDIAAACGQLRHEHESSGA
jgi:23S rRNA (adenine2503-C2)-methyltransferase